VQEVQREVKGMAATGAHLMSGQEPQVRALYQRSPNPLDLSLYAHPWPPCTGWGLCGLGNVWHSTGMGTSHQTQGSQLRVLHTQVRIRAL
jgi:hypothetical protein